LAVSGICLLNISSNENNQKILESTIVQLKKTLSFFTQFFNFLLVLRDFKTLCMCVLAWKLHCLGVYIALFVENDQRSGFGVFFFKTNKTVA